MIRTKIITSRYSGANISGLKSGNGFIGCLRLIGPFPAKEAHFNRLIQHGRSGGRVFFGPKNLRNFVFFNFSGSDFYSYQTEKGKRSQ